MNVRVCEEHPRRSRGLIRFVYVDADGTRYVTDHCPECAREEAEDEPRYVPQPDGSFLWTRV